MQDDGNLVVYKWHPIWASNTWNQRGFRILLQQDGNLVMYTKENQYFGERPIWNTKSYSHGANRRMRLTMTNDGNLVLDNNGQEVWSSEKNSGYMMEEI